MRKVLKPIIIIAVAVSALIAICVILHYSGSGTPVFKIFGSLDELSCFDSYDTSEIPDRSDLVEGLTIKDKRCFEVDFNGTAYSIYAYVFETPEDAAAFAGRYRKTDRSNCASYIISQDDKALLYIGGVFQNKAFKEYLYDHLSIEIDYLAADELDP